MWSIIVISVLIALIYKYIVQPMYYWKKKNVVYERNTPIFGCMLPLILKKSTIAEMYAKIYNKHQNERYVGIYNFTTPALLLRDPELIKKVFVKEFNTFPEHWPFLPKGIDPLWDKNIFAMDGGEEWRDVRSTLSPSFTGSKMKGMFEFMKDYSQQFSKFFLSEGDFVEVELKDVFVKYANDVIASTVFGVTCDSLTDSKNEFYVMAKDLSTFGPKARFLFLMNYFSKSLIKYMKIPMFSEKVHNFFTSLVKNNMRIRREQGIIRKDMIHLLMEAQKGLLKYEESDETPETGFAVVQESELGKIQRNQKALVTDEIITAQVLIFFLAGFDSVSTMMTYACYELAVNPDIQQTLREEVDDVLSKSNGEFNYENVSNMRYLDMIVSETLRKWPPFATVNRRSVKPFTIEPQQPGEPLLQLEAGSFIFCPINAIHFDPNYYPNPNKFDPERFNEQNRRNINTYTFLPFGIGPRNCIGSRFALLESKIIISEMISKFEIVPTQKTQIPIVVGKKGFGNLPDAGVWVGFRRRIK